MVDESSKTNTISLDVEELYWSIRFRASSYTGLWLRYKAGNMAGKVECQIRQTDRVQVCILIGLGELYWYIKLAYTAIVSITLVNNLLRIKLASQARR